MGRVIADHLFGPHSAFADFIYPTVLFSFGIAATVAILHRDQPACQGKADGGLPSPDGRPAGLSRIRNLQGDHHRQCGSTSRPHVQRSADTALVDAAARAATRYASACAPGELASAALFFALRVRAPRLLLPVSGYCASRCCSTDGSAELKSYAQAAIAARAHGARPDLRRRFQAHCSAPARAVHHRVLRREPRRVLCPRNRRSRHRLCLLRLGRRVRRHDARPVLGARGAQLRRGERSTAFPARDARSDARAGSRAQPLANPLFPVLGTWNLLLLAAGLLAATLPLVEATRRAVPRGVAPAPPRGTRDKRCALRSGFALVLRDRYLCLARGTRRAAQLREHDRRLLPDGAGAARHGPHGSPRIPGSTRAL